MCVIITESLRPWKARIKFMNTSYFFCNFFWISTWKLLYPGWRRVWEQWLAIPSARSGTPYTQNKSYYDSRMESLGAETRDTHKTNLISILAGGRQMYRGLKVLPLWNSLPTKQISFQLKGNLFVDWVKISISPKPPAGKVNIFSIQRDIGAIIFRPLYRGENSVNPYLKRIG